MSLNTRGRAKNRYQIIKSILARFGITVSLSVKDNFVKKKRIKEKFVNVQRDKKIYEIIYCLIHSDHNKYEKSFVDVIKYFSKYHDYLIE